MGRKGKERGGCCAPFSGELGLRLTQCGLGQGLLPYQVASSSIQPFAHNLEMEQKLGLHAPLLGGAATPCNNVALAEVYLRTEWHLDPSSCLATIDMGQKLGGGCAVSSGGESWVPITHKVAWAEAYLHIKWHLSQSSRLATTDIGRKLGAIYAPLGKGSWSPSYTMSPVTRPTSVDLPSSILIHLAVWPQ